MQIHPRMKMPCPNMSMNLWRAPADLYVDGGPLRLPRGHERPRAPPGGEYRSRTDDPLRARQVL